LKSHKPQHALEHHEVPFTVAPKFFSMAMGVMASAAGHRERLLTETGEALDALEAAMLERELTPEEQAAHASLTTKFAALKAGVERDGFMAQPQPRATLPSDIGDEPVVASKRPYGSGVTGGLPVGSSKRTFGFQNVGQWAIACVKMSRGHVDQRIMNAPTTFGSEGVSSDGGFAVPPDFKQAIMVQVLGEESLLSRCDQQITSSNSLSLPYDAVTPWDTSTGVTTQWLGEGATISASKPNIAMRETKLHKLAALVPLTSELLEDVPAMQAWLQSKVPSKITSALNNAIVRGTGVGQPLGLLSSAAKITQTAESGQGNGTLVTNNLVKMHSRMYARLRANGLWIAHQSIEPQLLTLTMPGTTPSWPAFMPFGGGISGKPFATLLGMPIVFVEAASTLGTEGDIVLTDLTQYLAVLKSSGLRSDVSIHLYYDSDHVAFRFILRVGGQPYWSAPVNPQNGSNTLSSIVTLSSTRT
jgi:HK97 family phage major capsid protein